MTSKCACPKTKGILIAIIVIIAVLIVIIGEKPRNTSKPDHPKQATTAQQPETPVIEKDSTDKFINTTGLNHDRIDLAVSKGKDQPENQQPQIWPLPDKPAGVKADAIKPALKKAIDLQSKNPGRYQSQTVSGTGEIFGIDTTSGELWLLTKDATNWQKLGHPAGMPSGGIGAFTLAGVSENKATIMSTTTAITWRVTIKDGEPEWVEISGPQSDQSWK